MIPIPTPILKAWFAVVGCIILCATLCWYCIVESGHTHRNRQEKYEETERWWLYTGLAMGSLLVGGAVALQCSEAAGADDADALKNSVRPASTFTPGQMPLRFSSNARDDNTLDALLAGA